jgi:hypothetical protein
VGVCEKLLENGGDVPRRVSNARYAWHINRKLILGFSSALVAISSLFMISADTGSTSLKRDRSPAWTKWKSPAAHRFRQSEITDVAVVVFSCPTMYISNHFPPLP